MHHSHTMKSHVLWHELFLPAKSVGNQTKTQQQKQQNTMYKQPNANKQPKKQKPRPPPKKKKNTKASLQKKCFFPPTRQVAARVDAQHFADDGESQADVVVAWAKWICRNQKPGRKKTKKTPFS